METSVVGVRFQEAGKIYYFEPGGYPDLTAGEAVVVETSRGIELGRVVVAPGHVLNTELTEPLKPILRPGTPDDIERADQLKEKAQEATRLARSRADALGLPMKVVAAQYTLDGSRLTVFFTAEERVDFRDLVRDLAHHVHAQVQLRQVGPRDQAKIVGGYGRCGRRLCCTSWLTAFPTISIKMAKEQNLPLNPSKISGQCGRLLCCLSYENDVYKQLRTELPKPESWVSTPSGNARVMAVNAIKQIVVLQMENMQVIEVTVAELGLSLGVTRPIPPPARPVAAPEVHSRPSALEDAAAPGTVHPPANAQHGNTGQTAAEASAGDGRPGPNGRLPQSAQPGRTASPAQPAATNAPPLPTEGSAEAGDTASLADAEPAAEGSGEPGRRRRRRRRRGGGHAAGGSA
ncbi:MAG TPA: regulatory iron-sulfur-containing complex subunit RicT [Dehalococcoidia bacterium]|jgi:cell fate regulator YaaT (PSP1 superfamily)